MFIYRMPVHTNACLTLLTSLHHSTYGIMHEHVNEWHSTKVRKFKRKTRILYVKDKQTSKHVKQKLGTIYRYMGIKAGV